MTTTAETETAAEAEEAPVHILWMNGGLSCDGDSVALTAATQPSIEEIMLGALPGLPRVAMHWPLLDFECGPGARRGHLHRLVVAGRIAASSSRSCSSSRARSRTRRTSPRATGPASATTPPTGQPMTAPAWLDRLAPKATAVIAVGTCATYGGIHAMAGNPTGAMGVRRLPRLGLEVQGGDCRSCACPAARSTRTTSPRRIVYLLYQLAGKAPMIPLDEDAAPAWLFSATVHEGCDRAGYYEQGELRHRASATRPAWSSWAAGARSCGATCPSAAGSTASAAARTSAGSASPARCPGSRTSSCRSWTSPGRRAPAGATTMHGTVIRRLRRIRAGEDRR